ncbi:DNA adenine methylase [Cryobacterium cheniae]|uniref:DNA adenine methylase n=1 Tax=Cryobacterium cheniae TaxID=1259262 RepID=UPI00141BDA0A|nr:DNA adenine methylase [Cryobacterium cheniae]
MIPRTAFPLPMQYMGSKQRIAGWILDEIAAAFPATETLVDLMSGSGSIANEAAARGLAIWANDIQPYSHRVLAAAFEVPRGELPEIIEWFESGGAQAILLDGPRSSLREALLVEQEFVAAQSSGDFDWQKYAEFCAAESGSHHEATGRFDLFSAYYPNTYFGIGQCLEIDAIQEMAAKLSPAGAQMVIGALISSLTFVASTTTHLAQYLKPGSEKTARNLVLRRSMNIEREVLSRLRALTRYPRPSFARTLNLGFQDALDTIDAAPKTTVVYADPPYFKEHYSRYYHVLDTVALYDYPSLTFNDRLNQVTVGRYREGRIVSAFGLRSKVEGAFRELFEMSMAKGYEVALSYANTSLLSAERITTIAEAVGFTVELKSIDLRHSGQGQAKAKSDVTEYLFLLSHA